MLSLSAVYCLLATGCGLYSFTGATIPDHLQTVAVPLAEVRAQGAVPGLDQALTDALVQRFADQTRLALATDEADADAVVRAVVERYAITPVAVTADELASLNRVTVAVGIVYVDRVEDEERLARSFSASEDYDPAEGPAAEAEAVAALVVQLADEVFTAATSDW
ncbi:MAG: LPS assembly lipoprotein LptE [Rubricoccaceae bacterium]|nr:LPS assembly lipoprotein LptE [Rubricoccaceae bacterium]